MIQTTIWDRDRETGRPVPIPPELLDRVAAASKFLETELRDLAEHFDIQVGWRFRETAPGVTDVLLDLETRGGGVLSAQYPAAEFSDTDELHRRLRRTLWHFSQVLSNVIKHDFERIGKDLRQLVAALGA